MNTSVLSASPQAARAASPSLRDIVALTKPRITTLVLATTSGGLWLAPGRSSSPLIPLFTILGIGLVVASANTLNMYWERNVDGRMRRTRDRPLPAGRLTPAFALWFGVTLSALAVPILALGVNVTTALLAVMAHVTYVLVYTPLKRRSHWALFVGAVAGAMPPLLGWTAMTGAVTAGGLVLFLILYFWQVPHFLAIALFRRAEYEQGGIKVMPIAAGIAVTKHSIVRHTAALYATSLLLIPLEIVDPAYGVLATLLGVPFLGLGLYGLSSGAGDRWARTLFFASLAYLPLLFFSIVLCA